tara:strand:- start:88 stop:759 length:672 start_codon:yes stop_codon:yes gene_type:complete
MYNQPACRELPYHNLKVVSYGKGSPNVVHKVTSEILKDKPDIILNIGPASSHDPKYRLGDVIVGTHCACTGALDIDSQNLIFHRGIEGANDRYTLFWRGDLSLIDLAMECAHSFEFHVQPGVIGTSDLRLRNRNRIAWMRNFFGTSCEDMEAGYLAYIAETYDIPFLSIQDVRESVFESSSIQEYEDLKDLKDLKYGSQKNSIHLVDAMCQKMMYEKNMKKNI